MFFLLGHVAMTEMLVVTVSIHRCHASEWPKDMSQYSMRYTLNHEIISLVAVRTYLHLNLCTILIKLVIWLSST